MRRASMPTVTTSPGLGLVAPFLAKYYGGAVGQTVDAPAGTVTTIEHHSQCAVYMTKIQADSIGDRADAPLHTVVSSGWHHGIVAAFLAKYYVNGVGQDIDDPVHTVSVSGEPYVLMDIGMRMLTPRELARAQGFPDWYVLEEADGKPVTKTQQIHKIGNSVCHQIAKVLAGANYVPDVRERKQIFAPLLAV